MLYINLFSMLNMLMQDADEGGACPQYHQPWGNLDPNRSKDHHPNNHHHHHNYYLLKSTDDQHRNRNIKTERSRGSNYATMIIIIPNHHQPSKESISTLSALEIAEQMTYFDQRILFSIRSEWVMMMVMMMMMVVMTRKKRKHQRYRNTGKNLIAGSSLARLGWRKTRRSLHQTSLSSPSASMMSVSRSWSSWSV